MRFIFLLALMISFLEGVEVKIASYNVENIFDLNNDGTINVLDLELLAKNYRKSGAVAWQ